MKSARGAIRARSSVERMQDEAVNALLKILEEPPPGVVFLLTTQCLDALLPTLVSRSRVLRFGPLADREMAPLLAGLEEEDRRFILRIARGAPGTAQRLASDPDALRVERAAFGAAAAFWAASSLDERLRLLAPLSERGEEADRFLLHLSLALREEMPRLPPERSDALLQLLRGLETNASRPLLVQRFAMA
jgi:DNA polymerase III subunit delta'